VHKVKSISMQRYFQLVFTSKCIGALNHVQSLVCYSECAWVWAWSISCWLQFTYQPLVLWLWIPHIASVSYFLF